MHKLDLLQQKTISISRGPLLITAGPGSGKTRVLIEKIKTLISRGVCPKNILAITFTNKAAEEIKSRLKLLTAQSPPLIATLHSLCVQILKTVSDTSFTIYTQHDQQQVIKLIKNKEKFKGNVKQFLAEIELYKSGQKNDLSGDTQKIYKKYQEFLKKNNAYDFNDLLLNTRDLLKNNKKICTKYQNQFEYVLVDEYQDISPIQDEIIKILAKPQNNLCAIGDADQAIYGFRGATIENFLNFSKSFTDAETIQLDTNYRSNNSIIQASLSLIKNNLKRIPANYKSNKQKDSPVKIVMCGDERDEAKFISSEIEKIMGGTMFLHQDEGLKETKKEYLFSDFAVLYRTNSFAPFIEQEFQHKGIPYQVIGRDNLWQKDEILLLLSILKYSATKDPLARRILVSKKVALTSIKGQRSKVKSQDSIVQTKLRELYKDNAEALDNIDKVVAIIESLQYKTIEDLLSQLALLSRETFIDERANCVKLMTLHQSKGLEFENVFIGGCEEKLIPLIKADSVNEIEEERRLFYVGMTRAKTNLFLTWAKYRRMYGKGEKREKSRFLDEIDKKYVEEKEFARRRRMKEQIELF